MDRLPPTVRPLTLRSLLVCDDVRAEADGRLSAIGIVNERLVVTADAGEGGDGRIVLPRITFLAVVGGLHGAERVAMRHRLVRADEDPSGESGFGPARAMRHQPLADEHNFVVEHWPAEFPGAGRYRFQLEVTTAEGRTRFERLFSLERLAPGPRQGTPPAPGRAEPEALDLRPHLFTALARAGLLPDEERFAAERERLGAAGAELLASRLTPALGNGAVARGASSLGLAASDLARVAGYGHAQTAALAELWGVEDQQAAAEAACLGGLLNLGIALFDRIVDEYPARAAPLHARIDEAALRGLGVAGADRRSGDPGIDLSVAVFVELLAGARALAVTAEEGPGAALQRLLLRMRDGELASAGPGRTRGRPPLAVLRALWRKSVLPLQASLALARLARGDGEEPDEERAALVRAGATALWITDDLVDLERDLASGRFSRPLWLLDRGTAPGEVAPGGRSSTRGALVESGILDAESARLAAALRRLQRAEAHGAARFAATISAAVRGWIGPNPLPRSP